MKCKEYYNIRSEIKDGDLVLYRGSRLLAKSIQYFDDAYYNHIGIVKWIGNRLFTIDMWYEGIEILPLSRRIKGYKDFCVVRPKDKSPQLIDVSIDSVFEKVERDTQYDYFLLPRIAFYKKTGIDLVGMGKKSRFTCSELAQYFTNNLEINCYKSINLITPQDFIRHKDDNEVEILFDLSPKI
jgi:hypothetical protein